MREETLLSGSIATMAAIIAAIVKGVALIIMWGWFIVPLEALGVPHIMGALIMLGVLTTFPSAPSETPRPMWYGLLYQVVITVLTLIALFLGWIIHLFM